ncbi:MAG: hypothetical protein U9O59_00255 [Actinomycetota bacterium]|nr:hypothetical protein [Actinomycetota bacterium]
MKILETVLHGFILAVVNMIGIVFGFGVYHFLMRYNQMLMQAPVAAVFSIIVFTTWIVVLKYKNVTRLLPECKLEFLLVFLFSMAWLPIIFIPLHYVTQGYITSFGNVYVNWLFQIPVNIFIVLIAYLIVSGKPRKK